MTEPLTVCCVKWGAEFGPEYPNRLAAAVDRHLTVPHRFVCFTEDPAGVEYETAPFGFPQLPGWWQKVWLFSRVWRGPMLYFDLDTLIVDSIDFVAERLDEFTILRGFYQPFRFGSGVMMIPKDFGQVVWREFRKNPTWAMHYCGKLGDGHWMQLCLGERDRWQDLYPGRFVSYKVHCDKAGWPRGAAVVNFHGLPRTHQAAEVRPWVASAWAGDHVAAAE